MKLLFLATAFLFCIISNAQTELNNVIIKAKSETVRESSGEDEGMMRGMGNIETNFTLFIKDSLTKVQMVNNFMNSITIMDRKTGINTMLTESQAEKKGYTTTAADREEQKRKRDSTMKAQKDKGDDRPQGGGGMRINFSSKFKSIEYTKDTKTINKIDCKKAIVTTVNNEDEETKTEVWYTDLYTLPKESNFGRGGMGGLDFGTLKGLPVYYETVRKMKMNNNESTMTTTYQITDLKTNAKIDDKEFAVPKGYKVKTYAEWKKDNPNGGMQVGGNKIRINL